MPTRREAMCAGFSSGTSQLPPSATNLLSSAAAYLVSVAPVVASLILSSLFSFSCSLPSQHLVLTPSFIQCVANSPRHLRLLNSVPSPLRQPFTGLETQSLPLWTSNMPAETANPRTRITPLPR
ncbi:uncharacterized protein K452DRAFT_77511 [Aplosporella prunicola CBS 121167]|uniref:Uncharacterized protein n=1 Tax=Aplosporella prunicola CBS 121167 TaxID=1176127 RepID=A0A6A6B7V0_9PEZI|nr:uncharacterized protein K452DRAFT_77511 [Aplosporella prunicola CBS 121167]KAF2139443.1 hypothetical protein K452DRAFT_77511 [Aplosporella prunicola CBS 121167]